MTEVSKFFLHQVFEANGSRNLCFTFLLCELGRLWNLMLLVCALNSPTCSQDMPAPGETCFVSGRDSETPSIPRTPSQVLVRFCEMCIMCKWNCLSQKYCQILSGLNFQKQTSRIGKVNYLSIIIVLIHSVWVPKSASLVK